MTAADEALAALRADETSERTAWTAFEQACFDLAMYRRDLAYRHKNATEPYCVFRHHMLDVWRALCLLEWIAVKSKAHVEATATGYVVTLTRALMEGE